MAPDFYNEYYEQDILWGKQKDEKRIIFTASLIPSDITSIIDVGCGDGIMLNYLQKQGRYKRLVGIDISSNALKYVNTEKILGSIDNIPFCDASFDLVLCLEVLEHLPYNVYPQALKELQRVSKKYILISVPNNEDIKGSFVSCPYCGCEFSPTRHLRTFSAKSVITLFPEFKLITLKFFDIRKKYIMEYYLKKIGRFLGLIEQFPHTAICPQCGFSKPINQETSFSKSINWGTSLIKKLIPYRKEHKWLIALYLKNEN